MPLELHIIRADEFIRADPTGRPDFNASKTILTNLARACLQHAIQRALLDLREVSLGPTAAFTTVELAALVDTFRQVGFSRQHRLAVLYTADPYHGVRAFAFLSNQHGWNVKAFRNYEEALNWLALSEAPIRVAGQQTAT